jgi:hypothetical protein
MSQSAKIRFVTIAVFGVGIAFSTFATAQTPQPEASRQQSQHRAEVTYTAGKLTVSADNSSLNQILEDIAGKTGMKITGGVVDERVFGQYGPDVPSKIVDALLDGTGSNVLLVQATGTTPAELILTPRNGGPTPPDPNAAARAEREAAQFPPPPRQPYPLPTPPAAPHTAAPAANAEGNPSATQPGNPESPNAVKTPQQIFEQLQRIRQQQQQQQNSQ